MYLTLTEFTQCRSLVSVSCSPSKTWPKCPPQLAHKISTRRMPKELSTSMVTDPLKHLSKAGQLYSGRGRRGRQKGQTLDQAESMGSTSSVRSAVQTEPPTYPQPLLNLDSAAIQVRAGQGDRAAVVGIAQNVRSPGNNVVGCQQAIIQPAASNGHESQKDIRKGTAWPCTCVQRMLARPANKVTVFGVEFVVLSAAGRLSTLQPQNLVFKVAESTLPFSLRLL